MSFIKKKKDEGTSIWDWIFLAAIILGGAGFWWYYKSQQTSTIAGFAQRGS